MRADYTMNDAAGGSESTSTTDWPARSRQPPVDRPLTLSTGANKPLLLRGSQGRGGDEPSPAEFEHHGVPPHHSTAFTTAPRPL
jgi:hypothetical protein